MKHLTDFRDQIVIKNLVIEKSNQDNSALLALHNSICTARLGLNKLSE